SFPAAPDTGIYTVPAGAASVSLYVQTTGLTSGSVACDDVFMERITETENRLMARHTVALDVNGRISGTINENDGQTSQFSILSDVFRVLSPGKPEGMEWQDGYLRVYGSGYQRIIGNNFGAPGQNLVDWFGPNVGAANASKANAVMWMDKSG